METNETKKFRFNWSEKGMGKDHLDHGEVWFETFDEAWKRFRQYALDHLTLGDNPDTGANGRVCRTFLKDEEWQYMLVLSNDDIYYFAYLTAKMEDVKVSIPGNITKQLLIEKGLVKNPKV